MIADGSDSSLQPPPYIRLPTFGIGPDQDDGEMGSSLNSGIMYSNHTAFKQNSEMSASSRPSPPTSDTISSMHDLHIKTDFQNLRRQSSVGSGELEPRMVSSASAASLTHRIPSVRSWLHSTAGSVSPGSVISSPMIAAMLDITPLPSPTLQAMESWKTLARTRSRASSASSRVELPPLLSAPAATLSPSSPRKKQYIGLHRHYQQSHDDNRSTDDESHSRNRSISDYVPEQPITKQRQHAVSGTGPDEHAKWMHREDYLGTQRGITPVVERSHEDEPDPKRSKTEIYNASSINSGHPRAYESLRLLGQGTFSKVYLAVRLVVDRKESVDYRKESTNMAGVRARSRRLVAVKVVEPGPAGGADADRIATSLKREVELMKLIQHPSIVHLKAFGTDSQGRALLVMNFCPGGDLFDVTSNQQNILSPTLIRRIFAELVSAVRYLHQKFIVHRDIKLENVLLNIPVQVHNDVSNWQTLDRAVVTLTDLGLSRTIPLPPESPLLETRCGSEDYAAPEILMGQPYGKSYHRWLSNLNHHKSITDESRWQTN